MYNSDINSSDRSSCSVPACLPPVWHALAAYSVFSSSHDMRALEHMSIWARCSCIVVVKQASQLFFLRPLVNPFFSLCLSWTDYPCVSTRVNGLLQRHVRSCNCACESQHGSLEVRPTADTHRCRSEAPLFDCLLFYAPQDCTKYDPLCTILLTH